MRLLLILLFFCSIGHSQSLINSYRYAVAASDPITGVSGLKAYVNRTSIDPTATAEGNTITSWNAVSPTTLNATGTGTGGLHIAANGDRQTNYNNSTKYSFGAASTLNFIPSTDSFFFVIKVGDADLINGCIICKSTAGTATRQYQIDVSVSSRITLWLGGNSIGMTTVDALANDLLIFNISATTVDVWKNGTQITTGATGIGTGTNSEDIEIGARGGGLYLDSGRLELVAIGSGTLTGTQITDINTFWNE